MSLNSKIGLAKDLFGTSSEPAQSVSRVYGTATADSSGGTVYVQIEDGDIIEAGTIGSISAGQTVTIHVQGGEPQVIAAEGWGDSIQSSVDEAVEVANATGQHFWEDDNGAHVTEVTREDWEDTTSQNYHAGYNSLWNSLGLLFRKALNNLVSITQSAVSFYDGAGNTSSNVTASFGSTGSQIGKSGQSHIEMDYRHMSLIDRDGSEYFAAGDLRDENGVAAIVASFEAIGGKRVYTLSPPASTTTGMTVTVSDGSGGTVTASTTQIEFSTAPTTGATITVSYPSTSPSAKYYTLGQRAGGSARGARSVAMGENVTSSGTNSVAMGTDVVASAENAVAMGLGTISRYPNAVVIGEYNSPRSNALFQIGCGTGDDARRNVMEVYRTGAWFPLGVGALDFQMNVRLRTTTAAGTEVSDFIAKESNVNVTYAASARWGGIVTFAINFSLTNNITVPASGILSSQITIGTLVGDYHPAVAHQWSTYGSNAGFASGYIDETGLMKMVYCNGTGSQRTINAGSVFNVRTVMVLDV